MKLSGLINYFKAYLYLKIKFRSKMMMKLIK